MNSPNMLAGVVVKTSGVNVQPRAINIQPSVRAASLLQCVYLPQLSSHCLYWNGSRSENRPSACVAGRTIQQSFLGLRTFQKAVRNLQTWQSMIHWLLSTSTSVQLLEQIAAVVLAMTANS